MANTIDLSQFHEVFFEESMEGLDVMESGLLGMDLNSPNEETINNVFRAAHSIKGGAGTFGFQSVSDFTHGLESVLDQLRSDEINLTEALQQALLEAVDFLRHMLTECQAERDIPESEVAEQLARLSGVELTQPQAVEIPDTETETPATDAWLITFKPEPAVFHTGNDPFRIIRELKDIGEIEVTALTEQLPDIGIIDPESCYLTWRIRIDNTTVSTRNCPMM